jgi:hypothetical protein
VTNTDIFIAALHSFCSYGTYPFNFGNNVKGSLSHTNFILSLHKEYKEISKGFTIQALQNIRRSETNGLNYGTAEIDEAIDSCRELYASSTGVSENQLSGLKQLCIVLQKQGNLIVRKVTGKGGRIAATILLPCDGKRMYNVINTTTAAGKELDANYHLLSQLWMEFGGSGLLFDFEGSDLPGVRDFYKKFGSINEAYFELHINRLPWLLKIFKK